MALSATMKLMVTIRFGHWLLTAMCFASAHALAFDGIHDWSSFNPNGDLTVGFRAHLRNNTDHEICCQVEFHFHHPSYGDQQMVRNICVSPGKENWDGPRSVTGGVGCLHTWGSDDDHPDKTICIDKQMFKNDYQIISCSPPS